MATQNILREEARLTDVIDPLGGSYYVEALTNEMEERIVALMDEVDARGGMYKAVESGFVQQRIGESARRFQEKVDSGEQIVVGVNAYQVAEDASARPALARPDPALMDAHRAAFARWKADRSNDAVRSALEALARATQAKGEGGDEHNLFGRSSPPRRPVPRTARSAACCDVNWGSGTRSRSSSRVGNVPAPEALVPSLAEPAAALLAGVVAGERASLARAISAVENGAPFAEALAAAAHAHAGRAHVVGITGAPGAGKSTLISALLGELLGRGGRVAIVAVDPSSPRTGGAVLGDRIRMGEFGADERVFIRSLASRGHLGGLSRTTAAVVDLLDAAGFETVIVETVGAGQSEVEIATLADSNVVVCPPGLGDDVQATKAGILEIADVFVVSKGDLPAAERTVRDLKDMLGLRARGTGWRPPVLAVTAPERAGIPALADALRDHARGVRHRAPLAPA